MTMTSALETSGRLECTHLADGKLVRLSGCFGEAELVGLRLALLTPLAEDCRDVVIDAGELTHITDEAVAILVAARDWAEFSGARLLVSRSAPALDQVLEDLAFTEALPRLSPLGGPAADAPAVTSVPSPRPPAD
jgi:anti-anti-sigma regulatory factor